MIVTLTREVACPCVCHKRQVSREALGECPTCKESGRVTERREIEVIGVEAFGWRAPVRHPGNENIDGRRAGPFDSPRAAMLDALKTVCGIEINPVGVQGERHEAFIAWMHAQVNGWTLDPAARAVMEGDDAER